MRWLRDLSKIASSLALSALITSCTVTYDDPPKAPRKRYSAASGGIFNCGAMSDAECKMARATNAVRVENGLPPLGVHSRCVAAAQDQSRSMVERGYFSHTRPLCNGEPPQTFSERMQPYSLDTVGENLAYGSRDIDVVIEMWMNSPGHRANILSPDYASIGVGLRADRWTQCFTSLEPDVLDPEPAPSLR